MRAYRLVKEKYRSEVLSGEGASFRHGARWNIAGQRAVYASDSRALAILETLAHVPRFPGMGDYVMVELEVPDELIEAPADAPDPIDKAAAKAFGATWFNEGRSAALLVPSVIAPQEKNLVLNAAHREFGKVSVTAMHPFNIDERVLALVKGRP